MPYFQPVIVEGRVFDLTHLEPFTFRFWSARANRELRVHVTFSNHCFTEKHDLAVDEEVAVAMVLRDQAGRTRRFCEMRYVLSHRLPTIVQGLNNGKAKVFQTMENRNWCYAMRVEDPAGPYYVFFEVRRAGKAAQAHQELNFVVESAYPQDAARSAPALKGAMAFQLLCGKVFLGERTSTRR